MRTFSIKTLGCKLNQYESARLARVLEEAGWSARPVGEEVDLALVNTCTVTDKSDRKCRTFIRQSARCSVLGKAVVTGCLVNRDGDGVRNMPEVMAAFDNRQETALLHLSRRLFAHDGGEDRAEPAFHKAPTLAEFVRTRGYIKVQDGCGAQCSYCIVPSVRGEPRSRSMESILQEARRLISEGCPELILTGITIGKYHDSDADLADLSADILDMDGDFRVRLSSIEPGHLTDKLLDLLGHPKLCSHLHVPLQSGSDRVLERMRRPYRADQFLQTVQRIRNRHPKVCIGTDMIVGFPGESDDDFKESLQMVRRVRFGYVHQFSFSPRSGTAAAALPRCSAQETLQRARRLRELAAETSLAYRTGLLGTALDCVVEFSRAQAKYTAISDSYVKIALEDSELNARYEGRIAKVCIHSAGVNETRGSIIEA
jgi:threonylcarbamoyladenosine tRNA methylthiotransferase MtaB